MYEFALPMSEYRQHTRSTFTPYQQVTETLKHEVNVSTGDIE